MGTMDKKLVVRISLMLFNTITNLGKDFEAEETVNTFLMDFCSKRVHTCPGFIHNPTGKFKK